MAAQRALKVGDLIFYRVENAEYRGVIVRIRRATGKLPACLVQGEYGWSKPYGLGAPTFSSEAVRFFFGFELFWWCLEEDIRLCS